MAGGVVDHKEKQGEAAFAVDKVKGLSKLEEEQLQVLVQQIVVLVVVEVVEAHNLAAVHAHNNAARVVDSGGNVVNTPPFGGKVTPPAVVEGMSPIVDYMGESLKVVGIATEAQNFVKFVVVAQMEEVEILDIDKLEGDRARATVASDDSDLVAAASQDFELRALLLELEYSYLNLPPSAPARNLKMGIVGAEPASKF